MEANPQNRQKRGFEAAMHRTVGGVGLVYARAAFLAG